MCGIVDGAHIPFVVHTPDYGIRYVNTHHEEAAVHIAEAYSRHHPPALRGHRQPRPGWGQHAGRADQRPRRGAPGGRHHLHPAQRHHPARPRRRLAGHRPGARWPDPITKFVGADHPRRPGARAGAGRVPGRDVGAPRAGVPGHPRRDAGRADRHRRPAPHPCGTQPCGAPRRRRPGRHRARRPNGWPQPSGRSCSPARACCGPRPRRSSSPSATTSRPA